MRLEKLSRGTSGEEDRIKRGLEKLRPLTRGNLQSTIIKNIDRSSDSASAKGSGS